MSRAVVADAVMKTRLASRLMFVTRAILPMQVKLLGQVKLQASPPHGLQSEVVPCLICLCNSNLMVLVQLQPCYVSATATDVQLNSGCMSTSTV